MWQGTYAVDNNPANQVFIKAVMASTTPMVINALACSKLLFSSSAVLQLSLNANVAFDSKAFGLENTTNDSPLGLDLRAWFIVPAPTALSQLISKLCLEVDGHVAINSGVQVKAHVSAFTYTPGCIYNTATTWTGQEHAGTVNFGQNTTCDFSPVGLPGTTLGGTTVVAATAGALGTRALLRDVSK